MDTQSMSKGRSGCWYQHKPLALSRVVDGEGAVWGCTAVGSGLGHGRAQRAECVTSTGQSLEK